jgi:hypothetical protein
MRDETGGRSYLRAGGGEKAQQIADTKAQPTRLYDRTGYPTTSDAGDRI